MILPGLAFARSLCIAWLLCLCCAAVAGPPRQKPVTQTRHGRDTLVINGTWKFQTDPADVGETQHWEKSASDKSIAMIVPMLWPASYTGITWYWREFDVPTNWKGQTIELRFEGVADSARVWVNGELAGEHADGVTPFEFDVTRTIKPGAKNLIAVRVTGNGKQGAGLWQGVQLRAHDEAYITDCFPQADSFGHMSVGIIFRNASNNSGDATLDARVTAVGAPTRDVQTTFQTLHLTPGNNQTTLLLSVPGKVVRCWSPESPVLYQLHLSFRQDKDILDTVETLFGFRTLAQQNGNVTINGAAVKLSASTPHFAQPLVIANTDEEQTSRDMLRHLKSSGVTVIYLEAPPAALLDLADQEGMLVIEGARQGEPAPERISELHDLVLRDRAHPCILCWNPGVATDEEAQSLRQLDPTRFLLLGPPSAPQLWPPGQYASSTAPAPMGLLER